MRRGRGGGRCEIRRVHHGDAHPFDLGVVQAHCHGGLRTWTDLDVTMHCERLRREAGVR